MCSTVFYRCRLRYVVVVWRRLAPRGGPMGQAAGEAMVAAYPSDISAECRELCSHPSGRECFVPFFVLPGDRRRHTAQGLYENLGRDRGFLFQRRACRFIDEELDVASRVPLKSLSKRIYVQRIGPWSPGKMETQHPAPRVEIWWSDVDQLVQPASTADRRVNILRLVGRRNYEDLLGRTRIEMRKKLGDLLRLVLLVATKPGAGRNESFKLVDENDGRGVVGSGIQQLTNSEHCLVNRW